MLVHANHTRRIGPLAWVLGAFLLCGVSGYAAPAGEAWAGQTELVGPLGNGRSDRPSMAGKGRYVAFVSDATDLVVGDTNDARDVFVFDRKTGTTERVSVGFGGAQANGPSNNPSISANGRHVAFHSAASNLVLGDGNDLADVFVHDRRTGRTRRVSVSSDGSQANGDSRAPSISGNGRLVAFASQATNLVQDDTNGVADVFVHDLRKGRTLRVGTNVYREDGEYSLSISAKGRHVAFASEDDDLVPGDGNGYLDVFVHDLGRRRTTRVSVGSGGSEANERSAYPAISANGRYVAFLSLATDLVPGDTNGELDAFVHDRRKRTTSRVSVASTGAESNDDSFGVSISKSGRIVAFSSEASNLVPGDDNGEDDVFVHDRKTGVTTRISVRSPGEAGDDGSLRPSISANGRLVAFVSRATNLAPNDANGDRNVFVHDLSARSLN